jgi:hypothetical protein
VLSFKDLIVIVTVSISKLILSISMSFTPPNSVFVLPSSVPYFLLKVL